MPQPLYKVSPRAAFYISHTPSRDRLKCALLIADVISAGSYLEVWLGAVLARILGTSAETGIAMYMSISNAAAQRAVITAAATSLLKGEDLDLFMAMLQVASKARGKRNTIAHAIWACSPDLPDSLLLIPPPVYLKSHSKAAAEELPLYQGGGIDFKDIYVYKESDLSEIVAQATRSINNLQSFDFYLHPDQTEPEHDRLRKTLCAEPDIQRELLRIQRGRKSTPTPPTQ